MPNLKESEYLADTISHRISQLITERNNLRRDLAGKSAGSVEQDKEFIRMYQTGITDNYAAIIKTARLEHLLLLR